MKSRLVNATLLVSAVLVTLGFLEVAIRVGGIGFRWGVCTGGLVSDPDPRLRYVPRADYRGYEAGAWVTTDSLGLRADRRSNAAAARRLLMLGDSMVFGFGVRDDQTMPHYLAELLRRELGSDVDVLNAGVTGYDTEQEFERGRQLFAATAPEAVLVVFIANDIEDVRFIVDAGGNLRGFRYQETGHECEPTSLVAAAELLLLRHSELYNMGRFAWTLWQAKRQVSVNDRDSLGREYQFTKAQWARWTSILDRARGIAAEWHVPVAFLVLTATLPDLATHDRVVDELTRRGFHVWSTLPEMGIFRAGTTPPNVAAMHLWWDIHPNPAGHRLLAGILLDRMKQDRWGPFSGSAPR